MTLSIPSGSTQFVTTLLFIMTCVFPPQAIAQEPQAQSALPTEERTMLVGDWLPKDPHQIDHQRLPRLPVEHVVVSDVRSTHGVNQHNYLAYFKDQFFLMWSDGPGIEDRVGQRVRYSISDDGIQWSTPRYLTPVPPSSGPDSPHYGTRSLMGKRWISRGFWKRDGQLLALCALDEAAGFFGPSLELRAFRWAAPNWVDIGVVADNAINNFPPQKTPEGSWMMSRRPYDYKTQGVEFLIGGVNQFNQWKSYPVLGTNDALSAEEPLWWALPNDHLVALFRDNRGSKFLYRSYSDDNGRTWSPPTRTNFPDATSKLFGFRLSDGRYILISNSNPRARDPLTLAISQDGQTFDQLAWLVGDRHVDYPHAIEHDGTLYIAFAGGKQTVELLRIKIKDLDSVKMPASLSADPPLPPLTLPSKKTNPWIDLGDEGATLFVLANLQVPARGDDVSMSLATRSGEKRVTIRVGPRGGLSADLFGITVQGPKLDEHSQHSILVRIDSHAHQPDELKVHLIPFNDAISEPEEWLIENRKGESAADLAQVILQHSETVNQASFRKIQIASTFSDLARPNSLKPCPMTLRASNMRADPRTSPYIDS